MTDKELLKIVADAKHVIKVMRFTIEEITDLCDEPDEQLAQKILRRVMKMVEELSDG